MTFIENPCFFKAQYKGIEWILLYKLI